MATPIPQHAHCKVCGKVTGPGKDTCSKKCEDEFTGLQKKRKQTLLIFYAAIGFFVILLVLQLAGL